MIDVREPVARWVTRVVAVGLGVIAAVSAVMSFTSVATWAGQAWPSESWMGYGVPVLTDALILVASLKVLIAVRAGLASAGWRFTAHLMIVGTVVINAQAATAPRFALVHVLAPVVWSIVVELTVRDAIGERHAAETGPSGRIPARLWLTEPIASARVAWHMARRGVRVVEDARLAVAQVRAARAALRIAERSGRVRRAVLAQVRAGSLAPGEVLAPALGSGRTISPVMRVMLEAVLRGPAVPGSAPVVEAAPAAMAPAPVVPALPVEAAPASRPLAAVDTPAEGLPVSPAARPHLVPSPALSAGQTKAALLLGALDETHGQVPAAMALLADRGVQVGKSVAYEAARTWRASTGRARVAVS